MILRVLHPHRKLLFGSAGLSISAALLELVPTLLVFLLARDLLAEPPRSDRLVTFGVLAFLAVALRYLLLGSALILSHTVAFRLLRELREQLIRKLAKTSEDTRARFSPGTLKKTLLEDLNALEGVVAHNVPDLASALIVPTLAFSALLTVSWPMALLSLALLPIAFAVQAVAMRDVSTQIQMWHDAERRAADALLEFVRGIVVLKSFERDASSLSEVRAGVSGVRDLGVSMSRRSSYAYMAFFVLLSSNLVIVLPAGLYLHGRGAVDTPELLLAILLGFGLTTPLVKLLFLFGDVQMNAERWARIRAVLDLPEERVTAGPSAAISISHELPAFSFERVTFSYDPERAPVLRDLSLTIPAGSITALVGPSGSGKSTLLRLLATHAELTSGQILLNGRDLAAHSAHALTETVTLVAQDALLFHGTLRDNLHLAAPSAGDAELESAAHAAGLTPVIEALPRGWDTLVGDRGATLSGGEAQRVAIARALLRNSPIVLLDEVTAHLDPENEHAVQTGLSALLRERTVVVVAHRLKTTMTASQILVLDGRGQLEAAGTHRELLERSPTYRTLWDAQRRASAWRLGRNVTITGGADA